MRMSKIGLIASTIGAAGFCLNLYLSCDKGLVAGMFLWGFLTVVSLLLVLLNGIELIIKRNKEETK